MRYRTASFLAGIALIAVGSSVATAQRKVIHSRYNLSIASSANMAHIHPTTGITARDRDFLRFMTQVDLSEIDLGKLAQRNGTGWARGFGADMRREHKMNLASVRKTAAQTGVYLPDGISRSDKAAYDRLSRLRGSSFDAAYRQAMIAGHKQVLAKVEAEMRNGRNSRIRDYAVFTETAIKLHLKLAEEGATMMGTKAG